MIFFFSLFTKNKKEKPKWHHVILIKFLSFPFNSSASNLIDLNSFSFTFLSNKTKSKYLNQAKFIISQYQKQYGKHKSNPSLTSFCVFFGNVNKSSWAKDWKFKIIHLILFWTQAEFDLITKLEYMFKLGSFYCWTNSSITYSF